VRILVRAGRAFLAAAAISLAGVGLQAQTEGETSHLLPSDHWAVEAAETIHALGLTDDYFPTTNAVPAATVARALREGAIAAEGGAMADVTGAWLRRWAEELGGSIVPERRVVLGGSAGGGLSGHRGTARPGRNLLPLPEDGPVRIPAAVDPQLFGSGWGASRHVAAQVRPAIEPNGIRLERAEIAGGVGIVRASLARTGVGYARGIVASPAAPFDHAALSLARPVLLPGFLGAVGPVTFHTFGGVLGDERHGDRPWLWGARGAVRPHPRLTVAVNRAAMLAGQENPTPASAANLLNTLIGRHVGDLADQIVSVDARWRLPVPAPATLYMEWGAEDSAGSFYNVPGVVLGLLIPALPALPGLSVGAEHAYFGHSRVTPDRINPPWYRHRQFTGGWVVGERMLGHPLGGNGAETAVYGRLTEPLTRIDVKGRAFLRDRRPENLFSPQRAGRSIGGTTTVAWRPASGATLRLDLSADLGSGWREGAGRAAFELHF